MCSSSAPVHNVCVKQNESWKAKGEMESIQISSWDWDERKERWVEGELEPTF